MKSFNITRKGYDTYEVEAYLLELEASLASKENQLAQIQEKEAAINRAVISAQLQAEQIISEANADAKTIREQAVAELDDIRERVMQLTGKLNAFQAEYDTLVKKYIIGLRSEDLTAIFNDLEAFAARLNGKEEEPADETREN